MRIKDISIRAFRLFEDEHIEFVNRRFEDKGSADFVSIYAPNGFGKTSFFDAIEFCVTQNVRRLKFPNFGENLRSDSKLNDSSFIHNKKMPDDNVKIRIGVEGHEGGDFVSEVKPEEERELLDGKGQNQFFSNAFLLQDWFSEFLSVTNSETRFNLFMQNFEETHDLLNYHRQLKSSYFSIGKDLSKKRRDLHAKRKALTEKIDGHFTDEIDKLVELLKEDGVTLTWKQQVNDSELTRLNIEAEQAVYQAGVELRQTNTALENCKKAEVGQDGLIAPEKLDASRKELEVLKSKIASLKTTLEKVHKLKALINEIEKLKQAKGELDENIKRLDYLIKNYQTFTELLKEIEAHEKDVIRLQGEIKTNTELIEQNKGKAAQQEGTIAEYQKQKTKIVNLLETLETEYAKYLQMQKELQDMQNLQQVLTATLATKRTEKDGTASILAKLLKIQKAVFGRTFTEATDEFVDECNQLAVLDRDIKTMEQDISAINDNVSKQTAYQDQVKTLLVHSREMIEQLKSGICPLCGHDYESMEELLKNVESNKAISSAVEELLKRKGELETAIQQKKRDKEAVFQNLEQKIKAKVEQVQALENTLTQDIQKQEKELKDCTLKITAISKSLEEDFATFKGVTQEQVKAAYINEQQVVEQKIREEGQRLKDLKEKINAQEKVISSAEAKVEELKKKVTDIKCMESFIDYQEKLAGQVANDTQRDNWNNERTECDKRREDFCAKIKGAEEESNKLSQVEQVSLSMETALAQEINAQEVAANNLSAQLFNTIMFLVRECIIENINQDSSSEDIVKLFRQAMNAFGMNIDRLAKRQKLLGDYQNLLIIADKYNQQQKIEKEISALAVAIAQEENLYNEVEQERKDLESYLEKYVQNYFQLDLINKLYNAIDPHPEYKEIEFRCDFSNRNPRLNVMMGSRNKEDDKIIPNLYFSTAQINILSFCIFMAKALFATTDKGEELGCIFIDDPIQALDDINILSMIDLLRNIAFTQKKQIVITTHDQNFFELLQKKIPQDKFNACYLQLKERGKFSVVE